VNTADPVVIVAAARTPIGSFQGALASLSAPELGGIAIREAVARSGADAESVQEVLMGCVLSAGAGQAPARQAALSAGLSTSVCCTTVAKVCGSGMKAVMLAHDWLVAGSGEVAVAGGMESMSNAPYLLPKARSGQRMGHGQVIDHMFFDGLEDRYAPETAGRLMGTFAEDCASDFGFTRAEQDAFAITSMKRAQAAAREGAFDPEIAPVALKRPRGDIDLRADEPPTKGDVAKVATLKPAFKTDGTVTAANASSIADGAAALVLMRRSDAERRGLAPLAAIVAHASSAVEPRHFPIAPIGAIQRLLLRAGWRVDDVDAWEVNEAFAVVPMAAMRELGIDHDRLNIYGGACALGHPIGASGARILVTLLSALRNAGGRRGVATLCIGGGEATAMAIELI
jgi:acetyl-CoA C-acetyltransferase